MFSGLLPPSSGDASSSAAPCSLLSCSLVCGYGWILHASLLSPPPCLFVLLVYFLYSTAPSRLKSRECCRQQNKTKMIGRTRMSKKSIRFMAFLVTTQNANSVAGRQTPAAVATSQDSKCRSTTPRPAPRKRAGSSPSAARPVSDQNRTQRQQQQLEAHGCRRGKSHRSSHVLHPPHHPRRPLNFRPD